MRLTFLGGAHEVGASCTLLEVAGRRILIDAGIRMGARDGDQLPNLSQIQEGGPLDAILLTHAHTDHIGALPLVHIAYPQIPIYTTAPTRRLTQILLVDALKIMESRWQQEKEIPLYPEHIVTTMLSRMRLVEPGQPFPLLGQEELITTFTPSGHVMGACSILLDTPDGRLLFTGDYSLDRQMTVEGMTLPKGRADLVVTESTYGNRLHANRKMEEERLVQSVARVVVLGGKVLIPAFALGRAQEVILLLLEAQRRGTIPRFPIYVDGMVKTVCAAYASFPEYLSRSLSKLIQKVGNPFFHEGASTVAVQAAQRQALADSQEPCCIVSSSGMLTGGPSQFYAAALAPDPQNAIFITGYQDEESPGRRVLDLADGKSRSLRLGDQEVEVHCQVGRYSLSAHADSAQMLGVLTRLAPQDVYLVHGDSDARSTLASSARDAMQVHLPRNGQSVEHVYRLPKHRRNLCLAQPGIGKGADLDLSKLRRYLLLTSPPNSLSFTLIDLTRTWFGSSFSSANLEHVSQQLSQAPGFSHDPQAGLYHLESDSEDQLPASKKQRRRARQEGRLEQNQALQRVDEILAYPPDLQRKGLNLPEGQILLTFHFPEVAARRYADKFEEIACQTGWKVALTPGVNQAALIQALQRLLPPTWSLARTPSIHLNQGRVSAQIQGPASETLSPAALADIENRYQEETGHRLQLEDESARQVAPAVRKNHRGADGRLEINLAFQHIRQAFQQQPAQLFRCSRKEDFATCTSWIELALISPQVAERYQRLRLELEKETGWPLRFASEPNQDFIKRRTRELIPPDWGLKKEPAFYKNEGYVQVATAIHPPSHHVEQLARAIEDETGYRLKVVPRLA